jgi:hypothetical protein
VPISVSRGPHYLRASFNQADVHPSQEEIFRHLKTDIASANDQRLLRLSFLKVGHQVQSALKCVNTEDPFGIDSVNRRSDGECACSDHEKVEGLPPVSCIPILTNPYSGLFEIDLLNRITCFYGDFLFFVQLFRFLGDQAFNIIDHLADNVGDASRCIRDMGPLLKYQDFQLLVETSGLCGGSHSRSIPSDHNKSL